MTLVRLKWLRISSINIFSRQFSKSGLSYIIPVHFLYYNSRVVYAILSFCSCEYGRIYHIKIQLRKNGIVGIYFHSKKIFDFFFSINRIIDLIIIIINQLCAHCRTIIIIKKIENIKKNWILDVI